MPRIRIAALVVLAVLAAPACARTTTGVDAPQAHAEPSTAPSSPTTAPSAFPPEKIDTLVLNVDEVNAIAKPDGGELNDRDALASSTPSPETLDMPGLDSACLTLLEGSGPESAFGGSLPAFRYKSYGAVGEKIVNQAVGVYSDQESAAKVFSGLSTKLSSCKAKLPRFTLTDPSGGVAQWIDPGPEGGYSAKKGCAGQYQVDKNIIWQIVVCNFQDRTAISNTVGVRLRARS